MIDPLPALDDGEHAVYAVAVREYQDFATLTFQRTGRVQRQPRPGFQQHCSEKLDYTAHRDATQA